MVSSSSMWNILKTNKKKAILIAVIVIVMIAFVVNRLIPDEKPVSEGSPSPTTSPSSIIKPKGEKINVTGVSINNIYNSEIRTNTRGDTLFLENTDYKILFFSKEEQFLLSIIGSPFNKKREQAEQSFLQTLGIDKDSACKLNVVVNTPSFANPDESGKNYKLSFCKE